MESVFDDLSQAIRAPTRKGARAIGFLLLAIGVAIGLAAVFDVALVDKSREPSIRHPSDSIGNIFHVVS